MRGHTFTKDLCVLSPAVLLASSLRGLGVDYADIRHVNALRESICVKNGQVEGANSREDAGAGVRGP